jgi:hypothetical protein
MDKRTGQHAATVRDKTNLEVARHRFIPVGKGPHRDLFA